MHRGTKIAGLRRAADAGKTIFFTLHRTSGFRSQLLLLAVPALIAASAAHANPKGGQVSGGSAVITQTNPSRLDIVQSTDRAAIDWQSFSIAPSEQTNFQQPAPTSMTLNRVAPGDPSVIAGRLTANGGVVLVNPSGITFSKGAVVDVNSLVATPTDISNANFMAGRMKFDKPSTDPRATVVNNGSITVAERGLAALVAPGVANSGVIQAKLGKVVLGGAQTYTLDFYGDGLISFDVGPKVTAVPTGPDGHPVKSLVSNTGRIDAPGGTVLLTADAAAGIIQNVVDAGGQITARGNGQTPGSVTIDAGSGGGANLSGTIDVSGLNPAQRGGSATVTGGAVNLAGTARIDARGAAGGGKVRVGGGPHGKDAMVRNAGTTTVAAGALIDTSATENGSGGQVSVWSDGRTYFAGTINARGGPLGGDGGWVETSGHSLGVSAEARVDALAPNGNVGTWLLDPASITVQSGGTGTLAQAADASDTTTNLMIDPVTINNAAANVTFEASNFVAFNSPISIAANGVTLTVNAGSGGISINAPITVNVFPTTYGVVLSSTGPIIENAGGSVTTGALRAVTLNDAGSAITLNSTGNNVSIVTLNALNAGGTALAPGPIAFASGIGFIVTGFSGSSFPADELGARTASSIVLSAGGPLGIISTLQAGTDVTLTSSSTIFEDFSIHNGVTLLGTITAGTLTGSSAGGTTLTNANLVTNLGAFTNIGAGGFALTNAQPLNVTGAINAGTGGLALTTTGTGSNLTLGGNLTASGQTVTLNSAGTITQSAPITAQNLAVRTQLDTGAAITLTDPGNAIPGNVTLSALNSAGTVPAAGAISFVDSTGFTVVAASASGLNGQEIGVNTAGPIALTAGPGGLAINGEVTTTLPFVPSPGAVGIRLVATGPITETVAGRVAAQALEVLTQKDGGAEIALTSSTNTASNRVVLTTLNSAGNARAPGNVTFNNSTGFTITSIVGGGQGGLETGVNTSGNAVLSANGPIVELMGATPPVRIAAQNLVVRTQLDAGAAITLTNAGNDVPGNITLSALNTAGTAPATGAISFVDSTGFTVAAQPSNGLNGQEIGINTAANVALQAGGMLLETGVIAAGTLTGSSVGGASLTQSNRVGTFGPFSNTTGGLLSFTNAQALATAGTVSSAGGLTLTTTGAGSNLTLGGNLTASGQTVTLNSAGTITEPAGGLITATTLTGRSVGGTTLNQTNQLANLGVFTNSGAGGFALTDGQTLTVTGAVDTGSGALALTTTSGNLVVGAGLTAGMPVTLSSAGVITISAPITSQAPASAYGVDLVSTGSIIENPGGSIVTASLRAITQNDAGAAITLNSTGNRVTNNVTLTAVNSQTTSPRALTPGSITFADSTGFTINSVTGNGVGGLELGVSTQADVVLTAGGPIGENNFAPNIGITAATLTGSSVGGASLTQRNLVGTFGPFTNTGGLLSFTDAQALATAGTVSSTGGLTLTTTGSGSNLTLGGNLTASGQTVTLASAGTINQASGAITAGTLTGSSAGNALFGQTGNLVANLGAFATTTGGNNGNFTLTDGQALNVTGLVNAGTGVVTLTSTGTITEVAGGLITAGTLTGSSAGNALFGQAGNLVANLGAFATTTGGSNGNFTLVDAQQAPLNITGAVRAGTGTVSLTTTRSGIVEQPGGVMDSGSLVINSVGPVTMGNANSIDTLAASITAVGNSFLFRNDSNTLTIGSVEGVSGATTNNGNILLETTTSGNLVLNQTVNAGTGLVGLSSAGTVTQAVTGAIVGSALEVLSLERVSLGAFVGPTDQAAPNLMATLAGRVTNAGESFVFRSDATSLTIGTVDVMDSFGVRLLDPATGVALTGSVSGVATNNANIGLRATGSGGLTLTGNVSAGSGGIGFESDGQLQLSGSLSGVVEISSEGPVSLSASAPVTLSAKITGAGNSFTFRDNGATLTIGSSDALREQGTGTPPNNQMLSIGGLVGVTTNNGNILLETTTSGNLVLNQTVNAGTGLVGLSSAGTVTQSVTGAIVGSALEVLSLERVSLGAFVGPTDQAAPNLVATLAGRVTNASQSFVFRSDATSLTIGTVDVMDSFGARLLDPATGVALTGSVSGVATNNANIGLRATGSGGLTSAANVSAGGGGVGLESGGQLQLTGSLSGVVEISSAGPVSLSASAPVTLSAKITGAGNSLSFRDTGATLTIGSSDLLIEQGTGTPPNNQMLSIAGLAGVTTNNGNILLETTTSGNLVLNQTVNAGTGLVGLSSAGNVTQAPPIIASSLAILSADRVSLGAFGGPNDPNQVGTLAGQVLNSGESFVFRNDAKTLMIGTVDVVDNFGARLLNPITGVALTGPLSGVVTNNANIGLRVTSSGDLLLTQNVTAGTAGVGLEAAGAIRQTGGAVTGSTLEVSALGPVSLPDTNAVPVLAGQVTGSLNSFLFRNEGLGLTVGTVPTLLETGTGVPASSQMLNVGGLSGVVTANGNISLETSGNLALTQSMNAGTGLVTLTVAGTISQTGGVITAGTLTGSSAGGTTLNQTNQLANLGPFTNTGAGGFALTDGQTLNVTGAVNAGTEGLGLTTTSGNLAVGAGLTAGTMVTLNSAGTITEPAGGVITAATLTGSSTGNASFGQTGNQVANLGAFATGNGDFTLTDGQALNLTGLLNAGTGVVTLNSAGMITELPGASIMAGTLTGSSVGDASFDQVNQLANLGAFTTSVNGVFTLTNNPALTVAGPLNAAGDVRITVNTGDLTLAGNVTTGGSSNATLASATGNITEAGDPVVTASGLNLDAPNGNVSLGIDGGTVFPANANVVGTLTGSAGGTFGFLNATALTVGTITGSAGDVLIQVNNGQPLTLAGNIKAGGRAILDTGGGFSQIGIASVSAPVLAIDSTGSGVNTLLGFITSPTVNASVISNLPPAGRTSNPIRFENLLAPNSVVLLFADQGSVAGPIQAAQLGLSGTGSVANLQGSINGVTGPTAALLGVRAPGPDPTYQLNGCTLGASTCVVIQPDQPLAFLVTQPQTASEIQALSVSPTLSAQFVLIQPEIVKGVRQSEDPDAPVINVFDEERLCDETAKSSQPNKEPCREER